MLGSAEKLIESAAHPIGEVYVITLGAGSLFALPMEGYDGEMGVFPVCFTDVRIAKGCLAGLQGKFPSRPWALGNTQFEAMRDHFSKTSNFPGIWVVDYSAKDLIPKILNGGICAADCRIVYVR